MGVDINTAFGKKGGNQITFLISLLIVVAIVVIAVKIYKGVKSGSKIVGDQLSDVLVSGQLGVSLATLTSLRALAQDLWDNGCEWYTIIWGYNYDEDMFINAINRCSNLKELNILNDQFKAAHTKGVDIKGVAKDAFNESDFNRIINPEFKVYLKR